MTDRSRGLPRPSARTAALAARRNAKMARSLGAYIRGSTKGFYDWLSRPAVPIPAGPPIWICGDCHVGNFGPIAAADDEIEIQIRDFDQTTIGNPAHDVIRLGLSLAADAATSDLSGVTTAYMLQHLLERYAARLTRRRSRNARDADDPKSLRKVLRVASSRSWKHLCKDRIDGSQRRIPLGRRFWPISPAERDEIVRLVASEEMNSLVTCLRHRDNGAKLDLLDAAYWIKGCSSLGRLRYAVLLAVKEKSGKSPEYCLIDIKQAVQSAAPVSGRQRLAKNAAERVVEGARHLSPAIGERMRPAHVLGRQVFVRELRPQDLKPEIPRLSPDEVIGLAGFLAEVLAEAHRAQMQPSVRKAWKRKVTAHSRRKGAPSWLWENVVGLMAMHERSYLEHCGRLRQSDGATGLFPFK
jgi:uncharacterized protein (DUF2252 family)